MARYVPQPFWQTVRHQTDSIVSQLVEAQAKWDAKIRCNKGGRLFRAGAEVRGPPLGRGEIGG